MNIIADITALNLPATEYVVLGSGVMGALKIRQNKDIDLLGTPELFERLKKAGWPYDVMHVDGRDRERLREGTVEVFKDFWYNNGQSELKLSEIVPHFINDIPFLPLEVLRSVKLKMGREKDLNDVILIDSYLESTKKN